MFWLTVILLFICLLLGWLFVSPVKLEVDTRNAKAELHWLSIGGVRIWYEEEWWLSMRILFYRKTMRFSEIKTKPKKIKKPGTKDKQKRKFKITRMMKMINVIGTFRVTEWQLAVDSGDHARNAQLHPLNYLPYSFGHLYINFMDENFLVLKAWNRPWKIVYAFLR